MIATSLTAVARAVGGRLVLPQGSGATPEDVVDGPVEVDSRRLAPGGLFVAVVGERVDGHDFVRAAADHGAVAVLGSRATALPTIVVDDPVAALGDLATDVLSRRRESGDVTVLALTGSAGKTSTKDLIAAVLAASEPDRSDAVVATAGNFNNEIGVPLTALRTGLRTRYLVLEMGARGIGHVADLCRIAAPDVAAVLNVGSAHLGEFGSRDAIAQAKGEIVEALAPGGAAVLAADDARVAAMAPRTAATVTTFGRAEGSTVRAAHEVSDEIGRVSFSLEHGDRSAPVHLRSPGRHQVLNALAAAACALAAGCDLAQVASALSEAHGGSPWRMEITDVDGITVVNDAYNANPESMRAAIDVLAGVTGRRGIAVLGAMGELGLDADQAHAGVGAYAVEAGVSVVLAVGTDAAGIADGARRAAAGTGCEVVSVTGHTAALHWLRANLRDDDVVLTKGSRSASMEVVALDLVEQGRGVHEGREHGHGRAAEDHA